MPKRRRVNGGFRRRVKRNTRRRRKRNTRRRIRAGRRTYGTSIVRVPGRVPFGKSFKTTLRYFETGVAINPPAAGILGTYVFLANGLFDPNVTGIGHQPLGFDQVMAAYDHYTVIASKIRVHFHNTSTSPVTCGVYMNDNATGSSDPRIVLENGSCIYTLLNDNDSSNSMKSLQKGSNPNSFLGRSNPLSEDDLRGTATSDPVEKAYWIIFAGSADNSDPSDVDLNIDIEYTVVFTEPKQLALS